MVKKKGGGHGESSGADEPHDREGVGAEDTTQSQQHSGETTTTGSHGAQNNNQPSSEGGTNSTEGGMGTASSNSNNNNPGGEGNSTKDLYDPFACTDSDTDSVKKGQGMDNSKHSATASSLAQKNMHQETEEESDEFSDIEPPPPVKESEGTSKAGDRQEKYDPLEPTDDPSPAPTPPPFTPMEEDDR